MMNHVDKEHSVHSNSKFVQGAVIGGLVGAAMALLLAPKLGRELRSDLSEKLSIVADKSKQICDTAAEKADTFAETINSHANTVIDGIKEVSADVAEELKITPTRGDE
jgi:gas vesicle protein